MPSKTSQRGEPRNPLADILERGGEAVNSLLDELVGKRRVGPELGKVAGRAASAKKAVDKNMEMLLSLLNVPSRADYEKLLAKIEALQGSMINLSMKLDRILASQQQAAPPPRPAKQVKGNPPRARKRRQLGGSRPQAADSGDLPNPSLG